MTMYYILYNPKTKISRHTSSDNVKAELFKDGYMLVAVAHGWNISVKDMVDE